MRTWNTSHSRTENSRHSTAEKYHQVYVVVEGPRKLLRSILFFALSCSRKLRSEAALVRLILIKYIFTSESRLETHSGHVYSHYQPGGGYSFTQVCQSSMGRALGFPKESLKEQSTHNVLKEVRALEYRMEYIKGAFRKNQDKWTTASLAGQEKKLTALKKKFEAISTTIESSISQSGDSTVLGIVHKGIQDNIAELTAALNSIAKLNSQQADETPNVIQERLQKMTVHTPAKYAMIHAKTGEGANPPEKGNDGQDTQSKAIKRTPPATGSTKRPVRQPLSQTGQIAPTPPSRQVIQTLPTASSGSGGQQKQGGSGSKNRVSSTGGEASTLEDGKWSESAWKQSAETLKVRWKTTKGFVIIYSRLEVSPTLHGQGFVTYVTEIHACRSHFPLGPLQRLNTSMSQLKLTGWPSLLVLSHRHSARQWQPK